MFFIVLNKIINFNSICNSRSPFLRIFITGDSSIQISYKKLILSPLPRIQLKPLFDEVPVVQIYFHIVEVLIVFLWLKKMTLVRHLADTTSTQIFFGSVITFHPNFSKRVALKSWIFLMPKTSSHFGLYIFPIIGIGP